MTQPPNPPYELLKVVPEPEHNHVTRDIKDRGKCPACDKFWDTSEPSQVQAAELLLKMAQEDREAQIPDGTFAQRIHNGSIFCALPWGSPDWSTWAIKVEFRNIDDDGTPLYAVTNTGTEFTSTGKPMYGRDRLNRRHRRMPLDVAENLARRLAVEHRINNLTAADVLALYAKHDQENQP